MRREDRVLKKDGRQVFGRRGEDLAAAFLATKGFQVIDRNWRSRSGEIDLIVSRGDEVRFIEVKCRRGDAYGYPEASITRKKLLHLAKTIEYWLRTQSHPPHTYQADAIAIQIHSGAPPDIHWVEGIL